MVWSFPTANVKILRVSIFITSRHTFKVHQVKTVISSMIYRHLCLLAIFTSFLCHSYVILMPFLCTCIQFSYHLYLCACHLYVTHMSFVCHSFILVCHLYALICHTYAPCINFVTCMSLIFHSYVLVCHSYVTRMYSYATHMCFYREAVENFLE